VAYLRALQRRGEKTQISTPTATSQRNPVERSRDQPEKSNRTKRRGGAPEPAAGESGRDRRRPERAEQRHERKPNKHRSRGEQAAICLYYRGDCLGTWGGLLGVGHDSWLAGDRPCPAAARLFGLRLLSRLVKVWLQPTISRQFLSLVFNHLQQSLVTTTLALSKFLYSHQIPDLNCCNH
jgi:hypothetical protein